jgi:hypothetical protein
MGRGLLRATDMEDIFFGTRQAAQGFFIKSRSDSVLGSEF